MVTMAITNQAVSQRRRAGLNAADLARLTSRQSAHRNSVVIVAELLLLPTVVALAVLTAMVALEGKRAQDLGGGSLLPKELRHESTFATPSRG